MGYCIECKEKAHPGRQTKFEALISKSGKRTKIICRTVIRNARPKNAISVAPDASECAKASPQQLRA